MTIFDSHIKMPLFLNGGAASANYGLLWGKESDSKIYWTTVSGGQMDLTGTVMPIKTITTATALTAYDYTILLGGGSSVSSYTNTTGKIYIIRNTTASSKTVPTYTVFGPATATTVAAYSAVTIQYDGTIWYQIQ
jgi:hypothetical protein